MSLMCSLCFSNESEIVLKNNIDKEYFCQNCMRLIGNMQTAVLDVFDSDSYTGVSWIPRSKKYIVFISPVPNERVVIGYFYHSFEGAMAYDHYVIAHDLDKKLNIIDRDSLTEKRIKEIKANEEIRIANKRKWKKKNEEL